MDSVGHADPLYIAPQCPDIGIRKGFGKLVKDLLRAAVLRNPLMYDGSPHLRNPLSLFRAGIRHSWYRCKTVNGNICCVADGLGG